MRNIRFLCIHFYLYSTNPAQPTNHPPNPTQPNPPQQQIYEEREQRNEELRVKRLAEMKALEGIGQGGFEPGPGPLLGLIIEGHSEGGQVSNEHQMSSRSGGGRGGWVVGRRSTVRFAATDDISVIDVGQGLGQGLVQEQGQGHDDEASHGTNASAAGGGAASSVGSSIAAPTGTVTEGGTSTTRSAKTSGLRGILINGETKKRPNVAARFGLKLGKAVTTTTTITVNNTTRKLNLPPGGPPTFSNKNITPPAIPMPFSTNKTTTSTTTKSNKRFNFGWVISSAKTMEPSTHTDSVEGIEVDNDDAVWRIEHRRRLEARRAARKQVIFPRGNPPPTPHPNPNIDPCRHRKKVISLSFSIVHNLYNLLY